MTLRPCRMPLVLKDLPAVCAEGEEPPGPLSNESDEKRRWPIPGGSILLWGWREAPRNMLASVSWYWVTVHPCEVCVRVRMWPGGFDLLASTHSEWGHLCTSMNGAPDEGDTHQLALMTGRFLRQAGPSPL